MFAVSRYRAYVSEVALQRVEHPEWRKGQTYFNVLYFDGFDPEFANEIRGSDRDPFHNDGKVGPLLEALSERWAKS